MSYFSTYYIALYKYMPNHVHNQGLMRHRIAPAYLITLIQVILLLVTALFMLNMYIGDPNEAHIAPA